VLFECYDGVAEDVSEIAIQFFLHFVIHIGISNAISNCHHEHFEADEGVLI
jgi:hypothetical protein